ncbi:HEPN domain-containing protein [Rhodocaloribacter litoris]|nr:HEPN domain-containing protein [Rhodocaloribacter litoris]
MPPESPTPGSPADWLRRARSDLTLARLSPPDGVLREDLCFHAQQAAEKALKALWVALEQPVPRTHNLKTLLEGSTPRLAIPDPGPARCLADGLCRPDPLSRRPRTRHTG